MNSLTVISPAKVNLSLRVLGKRPDGYHKVTTLFHRVSLADTLFLRKVPSGIQIRTNIPSLPTNSRNLIWKAFVLFQKKFPFSGGVSVRLRKQIPIGGGLGGGSSNAASFLRGLTKLYNLRISKKEFYQIGSQLGADVNFFLSDTNQALGTGVGEKIKPFPCRKRLWFVLITFPKCLSTAQVYRFYSLKFKKRGKAHTLSAACDFLTKENQVVKLPSYFRFGAFKQKAPFLMNDLQEVSEKLYPPIHRALQLFEELGVRTCLMSGSGPTVFAMAASESQAKVIKKVTQKRLRLYKKIFISHTM